jgi:hypothetical protein
VYPLWLKIWLSLLFIPAAIGCLPFIVMYFKVKGKPMWELSVWQKSLGNFLIAVPKGGYSRETWAAIRAMPLLFFLTGCAYLAFYIMVLVGSAWAVPVGIMILPLFLCLFYLFDFGMDAEWHHSGFTAGFFIQETLVTVAVLVPLVYLVQHVMRFLAP